MRASISEKTRLLKNESFDEDRSSLSKFSESFLKTKTFDRIMKEIFRKLLKNSICLKKIYGQGKLVPLQED